MNIGLIDCDLLSAPSACVPNLDIMKISSYYKSKRDIVSLLDETTNLDMYSKIFMRKDIKSNNYYSNLIVRPEVEYSGLAFCPKYIPMNEEIENATPDKLIYEMYYKKNNTFNRLTTSSKLKYNFILNSNPIRLSTDSKNITINQNKIFYSFPSSRISIYDENIAAIANLDDLLKEFSKRDVKVYFTKTQFFDAADLELMLSMIKSDWFYQKGNCFTINWNKSSDEFIENVLKDPINQKLVFEINMCPNIINMNYKRFLYRVEETLKLILFSYKNYLNPRVMILKPFSLLDRRYTEIIKGLKDVAYSHQSFITCANESLDFDEIYKLNPNLEELFLAIPKRR